MKAPFRLTKPTRLVLASLIAADQPMWGYQLRQATGLKSGTLYPILGRLRIHGWTTVEVETEPHPGRPARRLHRLTGHGRSQTEALTPAAAKNGHATPSRATAVLTVTVAAPDQAHARRWAETLAELVEREHGEEMGIETRIDSRPTPLTETETTP